LSGKGEKNGLVDVELWFYLGVSLEGRIFGLEIFEGGFRNFLESVGFGLG
jgi:hypothetical protein